MQGLKRMRKERRLKVQEIADLIGKTASAVYAYEKGIRNPKKKTVDILCKIFDCKMDDLW